MRIWRFHLGSCLRKVVVVTIFLSVITCWVLWSLVSPTTEQHSVSQRVTVSFTTEKCSNPPRVDLSVLPDSQNAMRSFLRENSAHPSKGRVLIVYRQTSIVFRWNIATILGSNRIPYSLVFINNERTVFPALKENGSPKYHVIVFESIKFYVDLSVRNRRLVDSYAREFSVGIVLFAGQENLLSHYVSQLGLRFRVGVKGLKNAELNPTSPILRITRAGGIVEGTLPLQHWVTFSSNHTTHEYVEVATEETAISPRIQNLDNDDEPQETHISKKLITVMLDKGDLDGIRRVYFGNGVGFWLHRMLLIDSLSYLSNEAISKPLDRWFLVDVDDIFVGKSGSRMTKDDVQAMISVQNRIRTKVPGFQFNLGFSGDHFLRGNEEEDKGDVEMIKNADKFWWFSHMWTHRKPHQITTSLDMKNELTKNVEFAKKHNIPINTSYAVAPHHSGVYPVHDLLYDSWKKLYNLKVTSTEEYPHLHPHELRRGFVHKGIQVLPRQTCGLYTKNLFLKNYPKGPKRLENMIYGGDLFQIFVDNPINIFMTHLSNYGNDRLALHTFENVVKYLQCWTNLKLRTEHPLVLAKMYFKLYPGDKEPLWTNPCNDKRHRYIWEAKKSCNRFPSMLIIGPQKSGTTALHLFLTMHPDVQSSEKSVTAYEEVQFFNGKNYLKGLDWYLNFFQETSGNKSMLFEKSANYFDSTLAPQRASHLLPKAKLITILIDPVKRAYSWYHHVKSHKLDAAIQNSFYNVITANNTSKNRELSGLGRRCIIPGLYAQHLERWLKYYPSSQILVVDGDELRINPAEVMLEVQQFLGVTLFDYSSKLRYDSDKKFYCVVLPNGRKKCLGKNKGRHYPQIDKKSKKYLENYYRKPNKELANLLRRLGKSLPNWLKEKKL